MGVLFCGVVASCRFVTKRRPCPPRPSFSNGQTCIKCIFSGCGRVSERQQHPPPPPLFLLQRIRTRVLHHPSHTNRFLLLFHLIRVSYPDVAAMSEGFPVVANLIPTPGVAGTFVCTSCRRAYKKCNIMMRHVLRRSHVCRNRRLVE